jgi:hypothetical protein
VGAHGLARSFASESAMEAYVSSATYGHVASLPLAFGVTWSSAGPNYDYSLRLNATSLFDTGKNNRFDHYAK